MTNDDLELGDDLQITKKTRQAAGAGTWVCGTIAGHRFDALVFPEHADSPEWEIGDSRISKLWVQRLADKRTVYHWDRGEDSPALTTRDRAALLLGLLAEGPQRELQLLPDNVGLVVDLQTLVKDRHRRARVAR